MSWDDWDEIRTCYPRIRSITVNKNTTYTNTCMLLDSHIKENEMGRECGMQEKKVKYEQGKN